MVHGRRIQVLVWCLILASLAALGIWSATFFLENKDRTGKPSTGQQHRYRLPPSKEPLSENNQALPNALPVEANGSIQEDRSTDSAHVGKPADDDVLLRISCQDNAGEPLANIAIRCVVYLPLEQSSRRHVRTLVKTTSESGDFTLTSAADHSVSLELTSDDWYLKPGTVALLSQGECVLHLAPTATLTISAFYDDGIPLSCDAVLFRLESGDSWRFKLREGKGLVKGVAIDSDLHCIIHAEERFPYQTHMCKFTQSEVTSKQELHVIVVLPENQHGKICLELLDGVLTPSHIVMIEQVPGFPSSQSVPVRVKSASWESGDLEVGGKYRVTLLGDPAWRSDWFEIRPGQVTTIQVQATKASTITAKIVDAVGGPISNAVLRVSDGTYLTYDKVGSPSIYVLSGARSDRGGVVSLTGMPAARLAIEVEAWGLEPVSREVELVAGETLDLGTIVLDAAVGEIFVELVDCAAGQKYAILIAQPSGPTILSMLELEGTKHKFSGLPRRKYLVGVTFAKGGTIVWGEVELTDQPSQTIYLDASEVLP
jgi:hypothetical protein